MQRGILSARNARGTRDKVMLFADGVPLKEGKTAENIFVAAREFSVRWRRLGHRGILTNAVVFDGLHVQPLTRLMATHTEKCCREDYGEPMTRENRRPYLSEWDLGFH